MQPDELVYHIIRGKKNLKRMKKEIYALVTLILRLIPTERPHWHDGDTWQSTSEHFAWELKVEGNHNPVRFSFMYQRRIRSGLVTAFTIDRRNIQMTWDEIEMIYEDLPNFLSSMINYFPGLQDQLKPFLKASEKQF